MKGFVGDVPATVQTGDELHLLNMGGVIGCCTGHHSSLGDAIKLEVKGLVCDETGQVLNIATGSSETVDALADTIGRLLDRPVEKTYGPAQAGDVRESWADVSAAREAIGYEPLVGFEEGLRRTIDAMLGAEAARR